MIVLDYKMPSMDGPQFATAYRQTPGAHAPIVLITAGGSAWERAREVAANACLGKPFGVDALLDLVARFVP